MTKIESITYGPEEATMIHMDNGASLPEQAIAHLADTTHAREEIYNATMYMEAAWNAAHPIPEGATIPAGTPVMMRDPRGLSYSGEGLDVSLEPDANSDFKYRTLTPLSEPEEWETSRFIYANGKMYERVNGEMGPHWVACGRFLQVLDRDEVAKLNPRPVEIK
ncbi:hypothetical protein [Dermabacter hominis]